MANGEATVAQATAEEEQAQEDAFNAGFGGEAADAPTETPAAGTTQLEQGFEGGAPETPEPTPAPAATPVAEAPKKVEIDPAELASLRTRADGAVESQKQFDKLFGQVGALKEIVTKLRTETPAGEVVALTEEDMGDLAKEYPEIAKLQLGALNKVLTKFKGTGGADPAAVDKIVSDRLTAARGEISQQMTSTVLNAVLPGWEEEVRTAAFDAWLKGQTADVQKLAASSNVADAARMLRLYDRHQSAPAVPTPTPAPRAQGTNQRQRQIAAAVTPKGDGAPASAPAGDDDFEAGFRSG